MKSMRAIVVGCVVLVGCQVDSALRPAMSPGKTKANLDASAGLPALRAAAGTSLDGVVSADVDNVNGSSFVSGTRGYFFEIMNQSASPVTGATVSLITGLGLSSFPGITALPVVSAPVTLAPGEETGYLKFGSLCCTLVPASFATGFDSRRTITPTRIGVGGGTQTVQITFKLTDPASAAGFYGFNVSVLPDIADVQLVTSSGPANLDEGETMSLGGGAPSSIQSWFVANPRFDKEYTFSATLQVSNNSGTPVDFKPLIIITTVPFASTSNAGTSATIFVPIATLDGSTPGIGGAAFAVDAVTTWQILKNETRSLKYTSLLRRSVDVTPPVVSHTISGSANAIGWYASDVTVTFNASDPESPVTTAGCAQQTVSATTPANGVTLTCVATSAGGQTTDAVTIKLDKTVPSISGRVTTGTLGANGWYTSDVGITWTPSASGPSGQTSSSDCATLALSSDTPNYAFTCTITSGAGIKSAPGTVTVRRDATRPVVAYAGNAGSYTVDQTVAIICSAADNLSGVASTTCAPIAGDASNFLVGINTYSATATDNAGNIGSGSTTFTVNVTSGGLCNLLDRWVSNSGVANSLCVKVQHGDYESFRNELTAQSGKKISDANATTLLRLVTGL
jgi:hypothetical protein